MFWAELKKVLGWRENCFRLKKKGNTWTEKKRKAGRKETKERRLKEGKGGAKLLQKGALKTEPEKKKEKGKKAEPKRKEEKGGAELNRGWTERKADSELGGWMRSFKHSIFLPIFSKKNYGELVCVGFNF